MKTTATITAGRFLSICIAIASFAAAPARAETMGELYEKAKAEKTLVFYAGGPTAPYEGRIKQFQAAFPGIRVSVRVASAMF